MTLETQTYMGNLVESPKLFSTKLSRSMKNINKSLSGLPPISRYNEGVNTICENVVNVSSIRPPSYEPFERIENAFECDSSASSWDREYFDETNDYPYPREGFFHSSRNMIFMTDEVQAHLKSSTSNSSHIENEQLRSTLTSPHHRSIRGFGMKQSQSEEERSKESTTKEKRKLTRQYFVTVFSICYAIFLVMFGAIVFIAEIVESKYYPLPQVFCIYMLLMAFAYFLYLYIDIRLYVYRARHQLKQRMERKRLIAEHIVQFKIPVTQLNINGTTNLDKLKLNEAAYARATRELNLPPIALVPHRYCFTSGKNGDSFYLKLGASWFAFGLVVYSALQCSYDAYFISSNGDHLFECASYMTLALNTLFPIYSLFSLYFIVKYMNVIVNVNQNLARLFLMHCIGTSLSMWVFTIIRETTDAIAEFDAEIPAAQVTELNETFEFAYNDCGKSNALNAIHRQFAPYLYPFVIEYCILVVGIWWKIYANINQCPRKTTTTNEDDIDALPNSNDKSSDANSLSDSSTNYLSKHYDAASEHDKDIEISYYLYADCRSSLRGVFIGLLFLIMTIVFIILMFVGFQNRLYLKTSITINNMFECVALFILNVATMCAYRKTTKLNINPNQVSKMDDILLVIPIPAFFMDCIFTLVPMIQQRAVLSICISTLRIIQVMLQTPFIIDGRRRCSNGTQSENRKIGRGIVIFLAIANMSLWIHKTFSGRGSHETDIRYGFYGYTLWNILNHISRPLIMFNRFHASVCLIDIWTHAYEPAKQH